MTYHWVSNKSNTMGVPSGTELLTLQNNMRLSPVLVGLRLLNLQFSMSRVLQNIILALPVLRFTVSGYLLDIFKLFRACMSFVHFILNIDFDKCLMMVQLLTVYHKMPLQIDLHVDFKIDRSSYIFEMGTCGL